MTTSELRETVRKAWSSVAAPPEQDMQFMEWGWGEEAARAFTGVAPVDVNINSAGFKAATPLFDLPPRAAAPYLGTYLLSLLKWLEFQENAGFFDDVMTRAHTLTVLTERDFWEDVIRKHLPLEAQKAVEEVAHHLVAKRDAFALDQEKVDTLLDLATSRNRS
jgi:hypothetical protein